MRTTVTSRTTRSRADWPRAADDLVVVHARETGTAGNLTTDAHLAALAIEHGAEMVSYDRDFARFDGLRHRLPG